MTYHSMMIQTEGDKQGITHMMTYDNYCTNIHIYRKRFYCPFNFYAVVVAKLFVRSAE
jgi:hypothetical protein